MACKGLCVKRITWKYKDNSPAGVRAGQSSVNGTVKGKFR